MNTILPAISRFAKSEDGVTAIEYALIAALIALLVVGGAELVGANVEFFFNTMGTELQDAQGGGAPPAGP